MSELGVAYENPLCPYCLERSYYSFLFFGRPYYRCRSCDLIFLKRTPPADNDEHIHYYRDKYHADRAHDQDSPLRRSLYSRILNDIEEHKNPGNLLDIGCGRGSFLIEAKNRGWQVMGVDPSIQSIQYACELLGDAAVLGTLQDIKPDLRFDIITSLDVLDHLFEPWAQISDMRNFLNRSGLLLLRFPNGLFHFRMIKLFSFLGISKAIQPYVIFHQHAFTPAFIRRLLHNAGFNNISIRNSWLSGTDFYTLHPLLGTVSYFANSFLWFFLKSIEIISMRHALWGTSLLVTAKKP